MKLIYLAPAALFLTACAGTPNAQHAAADDDLICRFSTESRGIDQPRKVCLTSTEWTMQRAAESDHRRGSRGAAFHNPPSFASY